MTINLFDVPDGDIIQDAIKVYIDVPYNCKDEAKRKGAKWCPIKSSWYTTKINKYHDSLIKQYGKKYYFKNK